MLNIVSKRITEYAPELTEELINSLFEVPPETKMGDYSLPCFAFAKILRKNPVVIAADFKRELDKAPLFAVHHTEAVNGYLNIFLDKAYLIRSILEQTLKESEIPSEMGKDKTICLDYSSPNIAKNFHVGHLRTTIIGNSIYKIYQKLGYDVVRINHLGDWGTQFGKLIVAFHNWSSREKVAAEGIQELLRIYVLFHKEAKENPSLEEEARLWFAKMENGNKEALELWQWFKDISMVEFDSIYQLLGIGFDYYTGESYYMDQVPEVLDLLSEKGLLEESEGAKIVSLEEYAIPPCLIVKKDGGSIYPSRDIAAALYRKKTFHFHKCLYVTGAEQKLHFAQVFKVIEKMGYSWSGDLIHIPYGLVSMSGEKLSTRAGNIVYAQELLQEAIQRARDAIEKKNPFLKEKEKTAEMVGVGAIIYHDLYTQRIKNIDFQWEDVLSFEGASGPYIQYTYARAKSILRKNTDAAADMDIDTEVLEEEYSYQLLKTLDRFSKAIVSAAADYEPSILARYVLELAQDFNKFYHKCPINNSEEAVKKARLLLVYAVQKVIKDSMELLGIQCPEEM